MSQRGVVFFRKQDDLGDEQQKELTQRLGELTGKPKASGLHIHPFFNAGLVLGGNDNEIDVVSSKQDKVVFGTPEKFPKRQTARKEWHTDIMWENVPSDYAVLRLVDLPQGGGGGMIFFSSWLSTPPSTDPSRSDTLWASGYELYDRISKPYQRFLESLTATYVQPSYDGIAKRHNHQLYTLPRGSPENIGSDFTAVHPVIRTHPVTGWKSLCSVGNHTQRINDLEDGESEQLLQWFTRLIIENHDLQVRHRWQNSNDVGMWIFLFLCKKRYPVREFRP